MRPPIWTSRADPVTARALQALPRVTPWQILFARLQPVKDWRLWWANLHILWFGIRYAFRRALRFCRGQFSRLSFGHKVTRECGFESNPNPLGLAEKFQD
jgi:hypothetical protein